MCQAPKSYKGSGPVSQRRLNKKLGQDIYKHVAKDADLFCCEEILLNEWLANKGLFYGIPSCDHTENAAVKGENTDEKMPILRRGSALQ